MAVQEHGWQWQKGPSENPPRPQQILDPEPNVWDCQTYCRASSRLSSARAGLDAIAIPEQACCNTSCLKFASCLPRTRSLFWGFKYPVLFEFTKSLILLQSMVALLLGCKLKCDPSMVSGAANSATYSMVAAIHSMQLCGMNKKLFCESDIDAFMPRRKRRNTRQRL